MKTDPTPARWGLIVSIGVAAAAMLGTLPGRTHGLGLITEWLIADLQLDRVAFATLNFWSTLLGAAFCLPVGWLIDRIGVRWVFLTVVLGLVASVLGMTTVQPNGNVLWLIVPEPSTSGTYATAPVPRDLFLMVLLTRGFGQSALSVVSLAIIGKAVGRSAGWPMGLYSFLVAIGFMAAFGVVKAVEPSLMNDWRTLWWGIGLGVLCVAPLAFVLRSTNRTDTSTTIDDGTSRTLLQALRTYSFWVFALATSYYGLVASGTSLFHQALLAERGFPREVFLNITILAPMVGLAANIAAGFLSRVVPLGFILCFALVVQGVAMVLFPTVTELWHVYAYAMAMGLAGGIQTVVFFSVWGKLYGPKHLGKIQAAAQLLTVLASAAGPLVLAVGNKMVGHYGPVVQWLAGVSFVLALATLLERRSRIVTSRS